MPGKLIVDEIEDSGGTSVIGRKNLIINGGMLVSQRGTSFASPTSTDYTLDRWQNTYTQDTGATTISQSSTSPDLFGSSLKIDCTTAEATVDAGNYWLLRQSFEGQDLQNLGYGTSSAKALTISFWVYSTKTGTFAVSLYNDDAAKSYVADVTVDSASTWEKKTVTIAGDTASGFNNDNGRSLILNIGLNAGSTFQTTAGSWTSGAYFGTSSTDNFLDNTANDFYITGVQMEIGSVATDFEVRPIGEELSLCRRYFHRFRASSGNYQTPQIGYCTGSGSGMGIADIYYDTEPFINFRAAPTASFTGTNSSGNWRIFRLYDNSTNDTQTLQSIGVSYTAIDDTNGFRLRLGYNWGTSGSAGNFTNQAHYRINSISGSPYIVVNLDCEL